MNVANFLEIALDCARRGWFVLPIPSDSKRPMYGLVPNGVSDATNDEAKVRKWWTAKPDANVGVACGKSRLAVLDCDNGNETVNDFRAWMDLEDIPATYTVRTGRRTCFGTHSYFTVPEEIPSGTWERKGRGGELRSRGYYVLAAGSRHKDSGQPYEVLLDVPLLALPDHIRAWRKEPEAVVMAGNGELDALRDALEKHGIDYEDRGDKLYVACPWAKDHSGYSGPSETALFVKNGVYCFKCHHSSCDGRGYAQYRMEAVK